jgi:uncharacterized protein (DUF433 family)
MALSAKPDLSVPIRTDEHGTIRVGNTRVTLDVVLARHQQGRTPEQIHESFPTLKLADIYAVISYYLNNRAEVDAYLGQQDKEAAQLRQEIEAKQPQTEPLRARLRTQIKRPPQDWWMRFLADENFDNDILRGVLSKSADFDYIRVQDTEIYQGDDLTVLAWAASEQRILLTHDAKTMPQPAYDRVAANLPMPGVFVVDDQAPIGVIIDELLAIIGASTAAEWESIVWYLPM